MEENKKPSRISGMEPLSLSFPPVMVTVPMIEAYHIWEGLSRIFEDYKLIEVDVISGKSNPIFVLKEGA